MLVTTFCLSLLLNDSFNLQNKRRDQPWRQEWSSAIYIFMFLSTHKAGVVSDMNYLQTVRGGGCSINGHDEKRACFFSAIQSRDEEVIALLLISLLLFIQFKFVITLLSTFTFLVWSSFSIMPHGHRRVSLTLSVIVTKQICTIIL